MKIIFSVYPIHMPLTGIGRYSWELATRLSGCEAIDEIKYFNLGRWVKDLEQMLEPGSAYSGLRSVLTRSKLAVRLYEKLSPAFFARQLKEYSDHIYHSPNFLLPHFPGISIATFHDMSIFRHPEYHQASQVALMRREIPKALERADHLIAVSEFTKREIIDLTGYPKNKISVVHNGVASEYYPRTEAELAHKLAKYELKHKRYFLSLATIEPRKNIDSILDAYQRLPQSVRKHYPLVIGGAPGWKSQATHERIQSLSRKGQVRYLGYAPEEDLPILYAGATAKIFVPFYEGFGLPALEAMASGTAVIVSDTSSLPEVAGGVGLTVSPADIAGITAKMELSLDRSRDLDRRLEAGVAIAGNMRWQNCAERTARIYQKALSR